MACLRGSDLTPDPPERWPGQPSGSGVATPDPQKDDPCWGSALTPDPPLKASPSGKTAESCGGFQAEGSLSSRVEFIMSATDDVTSLACTPRTRPSSLGDTAPSDARKSRRLSTKVKLDYAAIDNANEDDDLPLAPWH